MCTDAHSITLIFTKQDHAFDTKNIVLKSYLLIKNMKVVWRMNNPWQQPQQYYTANII